MSFYTALTGLNGSSADISATSNNIANVGTTGFKRSRVEFGDIFATSPLQNSSSSLGSGTILKGVKQQFTQGNIASSLNALDLAISGQGFFALKPSLSSAQTVYTRNGSLSVNNDRYVVDSAGQYLLTYPVNDDGSVTAKDLQSAVPLQLPVTSGDPQATSTINLGVNVPAAADVVPNRPQFSDGYQFNPNDPDTFTNSTSITIFDDLGNPTIATVYFIKTQAASATDPTNKYDTKLVINDQIIDPDLVNAVDDAGRQMFIDRFGRQTTTVPDDNYFLEGKGSPLYKLDDLNNKVPSSPASIQSEQTSFDFGEEGDKLVEIVTDPLMFKATREGDNQGSDVYWGKDFLLVNVDNSDQPVSIDIRPGKYNATQLASEVERAINEAYGDDRKLQVVQNVDDELKIDLLRSNPDGSVAPLDTPITVSLLGEDSFVTENITDFDITGSSPDFTREQFLAHTQVSINKALNGYARSTGAGVLGVQNISFTRSLGDKIEDIYEHNNIIQLDRFAKSATVGITLGTSTATSDISLMVADTDGSDAFEVVLEDTGTEMTAETMAAQFASSSTWATKGYAATASGSSLKITRLDGANFVIQKNADTTNSTLSLDSADMLAPATLTTTGDTTATLAATIAGNSETVSADGVSSKYMVYSYFGNRPQMSVYNEKVSTSGDATNPLVEYTATQNKMKLFFANDGALDAFSEDTFVRLSGEFLDVNGNETNDASNGALLNGREFQVLKVSRTTDADGGTRPFIELSTSGLALAENDFTISGTDNTLIALSDESTDVEAFFEGSYSVYEGSLENYSSKRMVIREIGTNADTNLGGFIASSAEFNFENGTDLTKLGLDVLSTLETSTHSTVDWVDEKDPPIKVGYDAVNQRLKFTVDRTVLGSGTDSNFSAYSIYSGSTTEGTSNLGIPSQDDADSVLIRGGEVLYGETFIADGEEIQSNDKRYGVSVTYNSDSKTFNFKSGTTGEQISKDGALGVNQDQIASNIQIGRYTISSEDGSAIKNINDPDATILGAGDNQLMGVGATKSDFIFTSGRGLKAQPAIAIGASANEDLTNVFRLSAQTNENVFNVSVNGINGIIEVPAGSYVGSTLAEALEQRINQISDPVSGETIGGVSVRYSSDDNNLTFTTGTTGDTSTIKVKGIARLGLDDVPLGVGSVPEITNLVQATNADGVALYVDDEGNVVESPPENLVTGYYPLYIDEGELTFDKTGKLVSPKNKVHYEKQEEGFSIALDVNFGASTQFAQPFSVLSVDQDGFTSGRLDGLEIDSSGTIRANYTNGQNNPLGKIVVANFNNQNGLKQIGNATYVETAVSGTPQVGEAGAEGFGNILSGSLERSNVDITEELVNLITAQRNFQASAKAIETTTGLTQTIINIRM